MHQVATKINRCQVELLKWNSQGHGNSAKRIKLIHSRRNGKVKGGRGQPRLEPMACDEGSIGLGIHRGGNFLELKGTESMASRE